MNTLIENQESDGIFFAGVCHLLIKGQGTVQLLKSIDGKNSFDPLTDASGELVIFTGHDPEDIIFNSQVMNDNQQVHYKLKCLEGEIQYKVAK